MLVGYSQRRIAKAMEDMVVSIDKTVRNSKSDIVQYVYGDDGFDSTSVERIPIRFLVMTEEEMLIHYRCMPSLKKNHMDEITRTKWYQDDVIKYRLLWKKELNRLLLLRSNVIEAMINTEFNDSCLCPVPFERLLERAVFERKSDDSTDLSPKDILDTVELFWKNLISCNILKPTLKVEALFWDWCSTKTLWKTYRLDRQSLSWFLVKVHHIFLSQSITPYESVGMIGSQHCAEPFIQLTLNRFHKSGQFSHLVSGVVRMKEIINAVKNPKTPSMTIVVQDGYDLETLGVELTEVLSDQVILDWDTEVPASGIDRCQSFKMSWNRWADISETKRLVIHIDKKLAIHLSVSPRLICNALRHCEWRKKMVDFDSLFSYSDLNSDDWWVCIQFSTDDIIWQSSHATLSKHTEGAEVEDDMVLMFIYEKMVKNCLVKGIRGLEDFYVSTKSFTEIIDGVPKNISKNVIFTKGSNLVDLLNRNEIVSGRAMTNHIREVEATLGIDAACASIEEEWRTVMTMNNAHVGTRHIKLISEAMCYRGFICPMTYQGICRETTSVIKKASFEKAMDSFIWGAAQGHNDTIDGCMESVCWNGILKAGTGKVEIYHEKYEIPACIQSNHNLVYSGKRVAYIPPSLEYMRSFLTPKTKRRMGKKSIIKSSDTIVVSFIEGNSSLFYPSSPHKFASKSQIAISFTKSGRFEPWNL
jgi:hypothetical protein